MGIKKDKIQSMYAFISEDETGEGIVGMLTRDGWIPMMGADTDRVKSIMPIIQQMVKETNKPIKLCLFTTRTEITEIKP